MGVMRAGCFICLVVLLCGSLMITSDYMTTSEEMFLSRLINPETGEVDNELAELLWISCREDLIHLGDLIEDLNLCLLEETLGSTNEIKPTSQSSAEGNIQKLNNVLHPCLKRTLLLCIRKNTRYLEFLPPRPDAPRHKLDPDSRRRIAESFASPPGPSRVLAPGHMPSEVSNVLPHTSTSSEPFSPVDYNRPLVVVERSSKKSGSGKKSDNNNTIIVAVVVTASVTFFLAALLFFCCGRLRNGGDIWNDERPLLSVSMSDYSVGPGNAFKEEKLSHQSLDEKFAALEATGRVVKSSADSLNTSNNINGQVLPPLKPPPGRTDVTHLGMPPLKPPPGRAQPLLHELPPTPPSPAPIKSSESSGPSAPPPPPKAPVVRPGPPPPPPPKAPGVRPGAPTPPIPKGGPAPPRPPPRIGSKAPRPPSGSKHPSSCEGAGMEDYGDGPKAKLKPFFWDKVLANPDNSMVWHQIKAGSFQFNEEMIETLFGYAPNDKRKIEGKRDSSGDQAPQYIQIVDAKKAQNLAIMLRALNVTMEEVQDALLEGNELPVEFLQTLLKMAPNADEELKLRLFSGELSQLGPAEQFLKAMVDIPYAFKRMEALLFMRSLQEEVANLMESFETLEVGCKELRSSRLFLKLLEAVLKTGNRMNSGTFRGGAQAFKLDTLLKLSDVKGVDGKTTLLHFVVQEIIRTEGIKATRAARGESKSSNSFNIDDFQEISNDDDMHYCSLGLQVVSNLSNELKNVKKAAAIDADNLTGTVAKLGHLLVKSKDFLNSDMKNSEEISGFHDKLKSFVQKAEVDVMRLLEEEKRIMDLVKSTADYFHGKAGKDEGIRLFVIVRDFLIILDKVCKEVREAQKKSAKTHKKDRSTGSTSSDPSQQQTHKNEGSTGSSSSDPGQQQTHKNEGSTGSSSSDPGQQQTHNKEGSTGSSSSDPSQQQTHKNEGSTGSSSTDPIQQQTHYKEGSTGSSSSDPSQQQTHRKEESTGSSSSNPSQKPSLDPRQRLFPAIAGQRMNDSSSDEEE